MDLEKLNQNPPKHAHKILWAILAVLLLVVIIGSVYWWKEIKKQTVSSKQETETLVGVDTDNSGIRDDIEQYISSKYSDDPNTVLVLDAYAKAQSSFMFSSNKQDSYTADAQREKASECLVSIKGLDEGYKIRDDLRVRIINTPLREQAYNKSDRNLSGGIFTPPPMEQWSKSCDGILNSTTADTSTWKTYRNAEYGFEFKYPSTWPIKDLLKSNRVNSQLIVGDDTGADNIANYPKCYIIFNFQFSQNSTIPGPEKVNYSNNRNEAQSCEDSLNQILATFKFTSKATPQPIETKPDNCLTRGECMLNTKP